MLTINCRDGMVHDWEPIGNGVLEAVPRDCRVDQEDEGEDSVLIVFDKDHTLVRPANGNTFFGPGDEPVPMPGIDARLEELRKARHFLAIASNQGGVAAGHKTHEDAIAEMKWAMRLTGISLGLFCPDGVEAKTPSCMLIDWHPHQRVFTTNVYDPIGAQRQFGIQVEGFRKPQAGMLQLARAIALRAGCNDDCLMVGDRNEDSEAAIAAGFDFEWAEQYFSAR